MPPQKKHILVVDDDEDMRLFMEATLQATGYDVTVASNGAEALFAIDKIDFDLLILDIQMPELNGLELLEAVKSHTETRSIPVLMASARRDTPSWAASVNLGAKKFLHKPFSGAHLVASVAKTLAS